MLVISDGGYLMVTWLLMSYFMVFVDAFSQDQEILIRKG